MNTPLRFYVSIAMLVALAGCATQGKPPPVISLDEPVQAQLLPEPPSPVEVVAVPEVLPIPAQLKPLPSLYGKSTPHAGGRQRRRRLIVMRHPFQKPYLATASRQYSEQDGSKRQASLMRAGAKHR